MDCRDCSRLIQEDWSHCPYCGCRSETADQKPEPGQYGTGVRKQVFEVIVRQALAGAAWKDLCAGPMRLNNISIEEVESEISRRLRSASRDVQDDDFLGLPDIRRRLLLLVDYLEALLSEIPKRAIMADLGQACAGVEALIVRVPPAGACKEAISSLWKLHERLNKMACEGESADLDVQLSNLIHELLLAGTKVPFYKRFEYRHFDSGRS
jgi:hypothetical protein